MSAHCPVTLAGESLWLLAEKAIYWPAQRCLLIADAHFGKAAAYRSLGQPVPRGTTASNLRVLEGLLAKLDCERLIFLGDFLHGPGSQVEATLAPLRAWRQRHPALRVTLIRGNHDQRSGDPPADLGIEVVDEPLSLGPFALCHDPVPRPGQHVLAGHVHPVYRLQGKGRQSLRLACFQLGPEVSLLPAFGAFTGGHRIAPMPDSRIYVVGEQRVWPVS